jgi:hypothetical protein
MTVWSDLVLVLESLERDPDKPMQSYPDPRSGPRNPPFHIRLKPWAADIAARLRDRFGDDVILIVGVFSYPDMRRVNSAGRELPARPHVAVPHISPSEMSITLDEPLEIRSGHTVDGSIRVHNRTPDMVIVHTTDRLRGRILNPDSGQPVSGSQGFAPLPGVAECEYWVYPQKSTSIPLTVVSGSIVASLGYAIPPGTWPMDVLLPLDNGTFRTDPLHVTVI